MRKIRTSFLVLLFLLAGGFGVTQVRNRVPATPAATPAATLAATLPPTPTREWATPRSVVVTAIRTAEPVQRFEVTSDLNVRMKPGGAIVGSLKQGAILSVKIAGDWALIASGEYAGKYVAAKYLRPAK